MPLPALRISRRRLHRPGISALSKRPFLLLSPLSDDVERPGLCDPRGLCELEKQALKQKTKCFFLEAHTAWPLRSPRLVRARGASTKAKDEVLLSRSSHRIQRGSRGLGISAARCMKEPSSSPSSSSSSSSSSSFSLVHVCVLDALRRRYYVPLALSCLLSTQGQRLIAGSHLGGASWHTYIHSLFSSSSSSSLPLCI